MTAAPTWDDLNGAITCVIYRARTAWLLAHAIEDTRMSSDVMGDAVAGFTEFMDMLADEVNELDERRGRVPVAGPA